ncbi:O-antigen ligase [Clostridium tepidiprofundi DSM 19306]|uniref:O-antigen ligase n=1 Tax=Clostridium tepidiprofundi DSM 19306 TaxID=1121338 RepID=A0A151B478_9CLOT|nr:O-antigen ligase family protein [Clostridium tepidiprofundi]KYH34457.1 O-antigen ligase [Clostridium tepidiprofundi DSM 19306]
MNDNKCMKLWYELPLIVVVAIIPLVVRMKVIPLKGVLFEFWKGQKVNYDFFSYYKMIGILILSILAVIALLILVLKKEIALKKTYFYIPICVYSFFVIMSTIFSEYKSASLWGYPDRYEGMFALLAYILILIVTINIMNSERSIKILIYSLFASASIIGIIGILQYFGHDIFGTSFGKNLILPGKYKKLASGLKFTLGEHKIYATLFHYNYVGSYMAMLFPLTLTFAVLIKNKKAKIMVSILSILMFANWVGSGSRAGLVGGIIALVVIIIMLRRYFIRHWKYMFPVIGVLLLLIIGINAVSSGAISKRIGQLINDTRMLSNNSNTDINNIQDVVTKGFNVEIIEKNKILRFGVENGKIVFRDTDNKLIKVNMEKGNKILLKNDTYNDYNIYLKIADTEEGKSNVIEVNKGKMNMYFILLKDGFRFINNKREAVTLSKVERWGFEGKEKIGSARGYIWSRSIPLLKHTVLLGHGPDTFAIYFPQKDYIGKYNAYGTMGMLVDKPHDLWLQVGINTGIMSLIAMVALFIMYIVSSIKVYFRNSFDDFYSVIGVSVFVAIVGYIGAAFFNDSVVSVAPIFWILLGIGISVNLTLANSKVEQ